MNRSMVGLLAELVLGDGCLATLVINRAGYDRRAKTGHRATYSDPKRGAGIPGTVGSAASIALIVGSTCLFSSASHSGSM